jgi:hypothetical protein
MLIGLTPILVEAEPTIMLACELKKILELDKELLYKINLFARRYVIGGLTFYDKAWYLANIANNKEICIVIKIFQMGHDNIEAAIISTSICNCCHCQQL